MTSPSIGDQRLRRRVTTVIASGLTGTGITSRQNPADITFCNRHYISIIPTGTVSGGVLSLRAEPVGATNSFAPLGIEALDLSVATNWTFDIVGFFDAFLVNITSAITGGGSIAVVVNYTIED